MYKTVRHGENSLQYTILPQTEEVLNNSGVKGKGRDYSPSIHVRRSRRRSTVKYVLLVAFGLMLALMLAAIPICVMNGALYARRAQMEHHESMTSAPLTPTGRELVKSRKKELKNTPYLRVNFMSGLYDTSMSTLKTTSSTTSLPIKMSTFKSLPSSVTNEKTTTPPWSMPALRSWKNSMSTTTIRPMTTEDHDTNHLTGTVSGTVPLLDNYMSMRPWENNIIIRPTVTPETITLRNIMRHHLRSPLPVKPVTARVFDDVLITTKSTTVKAPVNSELTTENTKMKDLKDTLLSADDDEEFKESLEVDEVFSLPPLKPELEQSDGDEVTVARAGTGGWYGARWPFVDTSSYFQWTAYSPGDNLLLPLLVAALSSMALVILLVLAVRRRKRSQSASTHIGLTTDIQEDDNTNLLADNAEEPDE